MDVVICEAVLVASEKLIESASSLVSQSISVMQDQLRIRPHHITWPNAYVARIRNHNRGYRRQLRIELGVERSRLLDRYSMGGAGVELGDELINAVQELLAVYVAVRTSWQLFSHQYDNCLLFLTDGERAEMEAAFADISFCKTDVEREVTQVASELSDWMPCFSIILPEAAFQRCLFTLSRGGWSRREVKRLVRPLVHDFSRLSAENVSLLQEDNMDFREIVGDLRNLRSGDVTVTEFYGSTQLFLRRRSTILSSLAHQGRTVVAIQDHFRAACLYPFAIPNVDGTLVPIDRLREAFGRYRSIRTKCEHILEACSSLKRKLGANRDLLAALSPIEFRIGEEEN